MDTVEAPSRLATYATTRAEGSKSYGPSAVAFLNEVGLELFEWQAAVMDEWLEVDDEDALTRRTACLIVARRNGKSWLIVARALFGMLFLDEYRTTYTAHRMDTAREVFDSFRAVLSHPRLSPLVEKVTLAHGKESITLTNGARFTIRTRSGHGGRGMETDLLILDEALILDHESLAALTPLTARAAAQGRGQILYASSAGSQDEESEILLGMRDKGRAVDGTDGDGLAYHEWTTDRGDDPTDPATWHAANPSLGSPILSESFLADARTRLSVEAFLREHLGIWTDSGDLPAIDPARWAELEASEPPPQATPATWISLDVDPARTSARVLGFYRSTDDRLAVSVLDSIDDPNGLDSDIHAQRVLALVAEYDPELIGYDRLTCVYVEQVLAAHGWKNRLRPLYGSKFSNGLGSLLARVRLGTIVHDGHADLADDLGRATARPFGDGALIFARKSVTSGTIAGAVALAAGCFLSSDELTL